MSFILLSSLVSLLSIGENMQARLELTEVKITVKAFEIFLKHLVGGLHTVYTKLKRLSITPLVCNVEQVSVF